LELEVVKRDTARGQGPLADYYGCTPHGGEEDIMNLVCFLGGPGTVIQIALSVAALFAALWIPRRIMMNQLYADLVREYRSSEMGEAILSVFYFYGETCKRQMADIPAEYKKKYEEQVEKPLKEGKPVDYAHALHFQRRLVSQFYSDMATLRYKRHFPRLSTKDMRGWFTPNETKLLAILLHMVEPAKAVFEEAREVPEPPQDDTPMNDLIYKLYEEVRGWE
jgi:hypothetical protein